MSEELENMDLEDILGEDALDGGEPSSAEAPEEDSDAGAIDLGEVGEEVVKKADPLNPIVNNVSSLLGAGVPQGSPVQVALEDPTLDDPLLESIKGEDPTVTILNNVLQEIAEEVCYLKAYRNTGWDDQADFSDVSAKRIRSLKTLVESLVEKEKLKNSKDTGKVDFHSKNFENVFAHFLNIVKETFEKVSVPKQYEDIFFTQLAKDLDGFERAAEKIYYGKKK